MTFEVMFCFVCNYSKCRRIIWPKVFKLVVATQSPKLDQVKFTGQLFMHHPIRRRSLQKVLSFLLSVKILLALG